MQVTLQEGGLHDPRHFSATLAAMSDEEALLEDTVFPEDEYPDPDLAELDELDSEEASE